MMPLQFAKYCRAQFNGSIGAAGVPPDHGRSRVITVKTKVAAAVWGAAEGADRQADRANAQAHPSLRCNVRCVVRRFPRPQPDAGRRRPQRRSRSQRPVPMSRKIGYASLHRADRKGRARRVASATPVLFWLARQNCTCGHAIRIRSAQPAQE